MGANGNVVRMEGKRFGALVVLCREGRIGKRAAWRCRCDCGNECVASGVKLREGTKKSCARGHYYKQPINTVSKAERRSYDAMLQRCYNEKDTVFKNYGGRGIRVHRKWRTSFAQFLSDVGPRPSPKHSLDRYPDWNGDYEPGNVRWATRQEQMRNTRATVRVLIDGASVPLIDYAEKIGVNSQMLKRRLRRGWKLEEALTKPVGTWRNHDPWPQEWLDKFKVR